MSNPIAERMEALWIVDYPRQRQTRWHQTFKELTAQVGQALGFSMGFAHSKGIEVRVEIELSSDTLRLWVRSADEEFVALDARIEPAPS